MLSCEHSCSIISVGEIKENKGFKKCFVVVKTKALTDGGAIIRPSGFFECEVAISDEAKYNELKSIVNPDDLHPCFFILRSFTYKEKGVEKLGKQLQLKRWWR